MSESAMGQNNNYVRYLNKYGLSHSRSIEVGQFTLDNQLINIWENCRKASVDLGLNYQAINKCALGKQKTSGGFIWRYIKNI